MQEPTKASPLQAWHTAHGATMGSFAGWNMPLWYTAGAVAEHRAVVTRVGLFDTSHMDLLLINGSGSFPLLQLCFTRDLRSCVAAARGPLTHGRCVYGAFLNPQGGVIDDAIIYQLHEHNYLCVVNAGMGGIIAGHLQNHVTDSGTRITLIGRDAAKMDLQGPLSGRILHEVLAEPERVLRDMPYYSFRGHFDRESPLADTLLKDGTPILLSRSGYTGEFGFEIFVRTQHALQVWNTVFAAGKDLGLIPCGLAARDSLRTGAVLPLSHQDIGPWPFINHPWPFALPYNAQGTAFTKPFIGDRVLALRQEADHTYPFVGYDPRKVLVQDHPLVFDAEEHEIGVVLTCVSDMAIDRCHDRIISLASPDKPETFKPRGLSCGFVKVKKRLVPGEIVELRDCRRGIKVVIVADIRPDRTARAPMAEMLHKQE